MRVGVTLSHCLTQCRWLSLAVPWWLTKPDLEMIVENVRVDSEQALVDHLDPLRKNIVQGSSACDILCPCLLKVRRERLPRLDRQEGPAHTV